MRKLAGTTMVRFSDYVNPTDAAEIIGCTVGRVYQMLRAQEIRDVIPVGKRRVLISRKVVENIAKSPASTARPRKKLSS